MKGKYCLSTCILWLQRWFVNCLFEAIILVVGKGSSSAQQEAKLSQNCISKLYILVQKNKIKHNIYVLPKIWKKTNYTENKYSTWQHSKTILVMIRWLNSDHLLSAIVHVLEARKWQSTLYSTWPGLYWTHIYKLRNQNQLESTSGQIMVCSVVSCIANIWLSILSCFRVSLSCKTLSQ